MTLQMEDEESGRELLGVEIARYQDTDFLYQVWNDDDYVEVDVVGETHLDEDDEGHIESTYVEGRIDRIDEDKYEWSIMANVRDNTEVSVVSYEDELNPEVESPDSLNQVAELERIMESAFNDESIRYN